MPPDPTRDEWIATAARRFQSVAGLPGSDALATAAELLNGAMFTLTDDPEVAADEEMSYWDNDEGE